MSDIRSLDLHGTLDGYRKRRFSPTELAKNYLDAIQKENATYNDFLEINAELTMKRAQELEAQINSSTKLPLFGVPIAVKDNFLCKGWKMTAGSKILAGYVSPYTAGCVERLEAAGALIVGKTNLDEFAMGSSNENSAYGPVRNPWDTSRVPGGSSGGSAAAVAAGHAVASLGTDTGGSIRQPASFCGVVGVKPSYGRVSRYGIVAFASSLDQVGPITRTVWDSARLLEVMAGYHTKDATSSRRVVPSYTEALQNYSLKNVRIGVSRDWLEGVDAEVRSSFEAALVTFQGEGAKIVDIKLPHVKYALSTYYIVAPSEASSNLARFDGVHYGHRTAKADTAEALYMRSRGEGFGPEVKMRIMLGTYALSAGYFDAFYMKANQVRALIQSDFEAAFTQCDCIASPTAPTTAFKLGEKTSDPLTMYLSDIFTLPVNLAGLPGISIPCGLDKRKLPIGLQIIGRNFEETQLFQVSHAFEKARGGFELPPPLKGGGK